ncbi:FMN-binding negative transcriptional regulator [Alicyclobacillus fodiniaquatilis]|uniref:FMN-binding negative transcriptional regulator n=1 Tax=Alicyclobacillus fodiniaquatilis TaxID=1661150 RepID=A0ABW4JJD4_9BACL
MYIPKPFTMSDPAEIESFIRKHSFGILMSDDNGTPLATHLPFFYDAEQNALFSHMAKENPQWQHLDGRTVLAVFSGPHAYISPAWYELPASVPTWNYMAVHVYGKCSVIESEGELAEVLERTVRFYEPDSDLPSQADEMFYRNMMKAIVGFRIDITDMQGVAKLSQNKPVAVQERVIANLGVSADVGAKAVADQMRTRLKGIGL